MARKAGKWYNKKICWAGKISHHAAGSPVKQRQLCFTWYGNEELADIILAEREPTTWGTRGAILQYINRLAYFIFFFLGATFSLAGVIPLEIARKYQVDTYVIGYVFALLTLGNSLAILGNGCLLDEVNLQKDTLAGLALICVGIVGITVLSPDLFFFSCFILMYGLGLGILCSVGNYLIVSLYRDQGRAVKLNLLNFFYSFGAVLSPAIAGFLLHHRVSWEALYQLTLMLVAVMWYGVISVPFSLISRQPLNVTEECRQPWGKKVYLIGLGLFFYVLSEMIFTYWIIVYLMDYLALDIVQAGFSLSIFWIFMAVGRLLSSYLVTIFPIERYILGSSMLAVFSYVMLLHSYSLWGAYFWIVLMGLGYSGLYASIVSYGTSQLQEASSRLMTFFVTIGASGGILSFLLASLCKQLFNVKTSLLVSAVLMGLVAVAIGLTAGKKSEMAGKI